MAEETIYVVLKLSGFGQIYEHVGLAGLLALSRSSFV